MGDMLTDLLPLINDEEITTAFDNFWFSLMDMCDGNSDVALEAIEDLFMNEGGGR